MKKYIRVAFILFCDIVIIFLASFAALLLGFELSLTSGIGQYTEVILSYLFINIVSTVAIFALFGLYTSIWEFASINEAGKVVIASILTTLAFYFGSNFMGLSLPENYYIIYFLLIMSLSIIPRFSYRALRIIKFSYIRQGIQDRRIMIIGAGRAANLLIRDINTSIKFTKSKVVCVIDDDDQKIGNRLHGIKVVGTRKNIPEAVKKYKVNEIIYAIPSASIQDKAEILNVCKETKCKLKTLPSMYQLINGSVNFANVRSVEIEDLLGRQPIKVDNQAIIGYVRNKTILVTGGGGSIGSELCRQIAESSPKQLIIFDIYENNAYEIQNELKRKYPNLVLIVLIGSVRDKNRVNSVFEKYRPNIVFHAAAHKHVPLMEDSPNEAIKNNVFGTFTTIQAADKYGTERFVLISTDKAVNPTNVMGASKRICEMIAQSFNKTSKTDYVAVRFGNVLGSNGSVIPLFKQQINNGGPVLVTHPDIIRYFMTISEAVSLVIEAGAIAKGGEIFILDMGQPVKILDLAETLIKLSGLEPYVDIEVKFSGLRPGEKLYEELLMEEEGLKSTFNELIFIGKPINIDSNELFAKLEKLREAIDNEDCNIRELITEIVPICSNGKQATEKEQIK
ncbi:MAG: nucleoside-diphosphate sugar epimerase [Clostridiales bacterium GWF2_36_10]|nr:MAG: nucleoside-diphosphate sugar epimerase [Clostridiales bacterium GWF2_36_10]